MTYIFPALDLATDLHEWSKEFCEPRKLHVPSQEECVDIVVALVDDTITERMKWCDGENKFDDELEKKYPWYKSVSGEESDHNSSDFYYYVLDHIFLKVQSIVSELIPKQTWVVWYISKRGRDVFIEAGEDYRVLDWERRMASGEWKND